MAPYNQNSDKNTRRSRTRGCLLGAAGGNAFGAPVENMDLAGIRDRFGPTGVTRLEAAYGRKGAITDDMQMALFAAEGLILARVRQEYASREATLEAIYHALLRWLYTQDSHHQEQLIQAHGTCAVVDGILTGHRELFSRRSPESDCLDALGAGRMGSLSEPANRSRGCSGLLRAIVVGLAGLEEQYAFHLGCACTAITHGHPDAYVSGGFLAVLITQLVGGKKLEEAILTGVAMVKGQPDHGGCLKSIETAVNLSGEPQVMAQAIETLGGQTADTALAIGLLGAMAGADDFCRGVKLAVNQSGLSDCAGGITGAILGAFNGAGVIPNSWLYQIEMKSLIEEVAGDLFEQYSH